MLQIGIAFGLGPIALEEAQLPSFAKLLQIFIKIPRIDAFAWIFGVIEWQLLVGFIIILPAVRFGSEAGVLDVIDVEIGVVDDDGLVEPIVLDGRQPLRVLSPLFGGPFGFH